MKKILFLVALLSILSQPVFAEDCMHDPIYDRDWNAVVTTGVRIRSIPCMETSEVLATAPVGEVLHVIAETDGYYKIERKDGTVGWIGQWLVAPTDQTFGKEQPKEPLYDTTGHRYETAIRYLYTRGIVGGYDDMTYRPDQTVNRAEFVKIIIGAVYSYDPEEDTSGGNIYSNSGLGFSDVPSGEWYVPYLRVALENNVLSGYPDGTFKPGNTINLVEASKILVNAFQLPTSEEDITPWYKPYLNALQNQSFIPSTLKTFTQKVTRGEMAEFMWRIMGEVHSQPFSTFSF